MKNIFSKSNGITLIILFIVSILTILWVNANAESVNLPLQPVSHTIDTAYMKNIVGISLSKTCIKQIQLNTTVTCPTYEQLIKLGYDQSSTRSGKFIIKQGILQREYTKVRNEAIYYLDIQNATIVDPSYLLSLKIKTIIIEPSLKSYLLPSDMVKLNNTRLVHKERYINSQCTIATISSNNWQTILPDTIHYLRQNCSGELLNTLDKIIDDTTKTDITTSQKYKEDHFKQETKIKYKNKSFIGTNDNSTNKSVTEDKDPKYIPPKTPPFDYSKFK